LLLLCLPFASAMAADSQVKTSVLANDTFSVISTSSKSHDAGSTSYPLLLGDNGGLDFDIGGIDTRKLQLQINQPISLFTGARAQSLNHGGNMLGLDATLNVPVQDHFNLTAGVDRQIGQAQFQSLGSIQCMNGVLRADSYTASGCRFINEPVTNSSRTRLDLGASMGLGNASASFNWFSQGAEAGQFGPQSYNRPAVLPAMGNNLLSPNLGNPLLATATRDPLQYLNSEASGVDLNFKVGIATDNSGDLQLGLAFSRILDAEYQGLYHNSTEPLSWTVAEPFNTARMNLEWRRGSVSSGIQAYYRDSVEFLNHNSLDSLTTFDVHFTWRTPWNANLSVGASNILNAGTQNPGSTENQAADPFESIYGRIPYVRYKQDL
jgi:hypothetical protein